MNTEHFSNSIYTNGFLKRVYYNILVVLFATRSNTRLLVVNFYWKFTRSDESFYFQSDRKSIHYVFIFRFILISVIKVNDIIQYINTLKSVSKSSYK